MKSNRQLVFSVTERIRYADVDRMGVVYNGNYLRLFEIGRTELMRNFGIPYVDFESKGYLLPLVEANIKWKGSARYDDVVEIKTIFDPATINSTIRFDYEILLDGEIIAFGYTIHSFVRADNFRAVKPPKFFLDYLEKLTNIEYI